MIVIMTYHTLIEKDPNKVKKTWKYSTITILLIATAASGFVSFSLNKLMDSFDSNCVLNTHVQFDLVEPEQSTQINKNSDGDNSTDEVLLTREQYDFRLNERMLHVMSKLKYRRSENDPVFQKDLAFAAKHKISLSTHWLTTPECDWSLYLPLFFAFISVVWASFFMMCGHGGASSGFLPSPWKIVLPSIICFSLMTFASLAYMTSVNRGLREFCRGFREAMPNFMCSEMLDMFQENKFIEMAAGYHYSLMAIFVWVLAGCWATCLGIMVMRLVLTVDFELVNVKVMKLDQRASQQLKSKINTGTEAPLVPSVLHLKNSLENVDAIVQVYPVDDATPGTSQQSSDELEMFINDVKYTVVSDDDSAQSSRRSGSKSKSSVELEVFESKGK